MKQEQNYLFELPKNTHLRRAVVGQLESLGWKFFSSNVESSYINSNEYNGLAVGNCNVLSGHDLTDSDYHRVSAIALLNSPEEYRLEEFKSAAEGVNHFNEYQCFSENYENHVMTKQGQIRMPEDGSPEKQLCLAYKGGGEVSIWTKGQTSEGAHVHLYVNELKEMIKVIENLSCLQS